jgi:hypothetical protein
MKSTLSAFVLAGLLTAASPLLADEHDLEVITVGTDKFLRWHGQADRTYFIQVSDPNDHLRKWTWAPIIETGNDEDISYEVDGTADKGFFRLWFSDQFTNDPDGDDFDYDGLSNWDEVNVHQTNPLKWDSDDDGMPDGWEIMHGLNPNDPADANLDNDNDGLTNLEEYHYGTDPNNPDSDGDGITDGGEVDEGTDPNDSLDRPESEWVIITGDLDVGEAATKSRTITIPAGQKRLVVIGASSIEYPTYTSGEGLDENGQPFVFNDLVSWTVTPSTGDTLAGGFDVNSRHAEWEEEDERSFSLKGFGPAVLEEAKTYEAPSDAALTLNIEVSATNIGDGGLPSTVIVGILPVDAIPDWDRDGSITEADRGKATEDQPWFWWINDDDSDAAEPHFGDVPEQGIDNADQFVNGPRDLVDYFPVKLDIKALLEVFPPADNEYRLIHANGAINFVEMPDIQPDSGRIGNGAGSFLANEAVALDALAAPHKSTGGAEGGLIGEGFLAACQNGAGVLLLEGTQGANQPLELLISTKPGQGTSNLQKKQRAKAKALRLEIQACEQLIWRGDIRPAAYGNEVGEVQQPPDARWQSQLKDRWFVFCHGYNVSAEAARGWNTQVFKRLHQYGSDAKFVGISWEGNQGQINEAIPFAGGATPDYWHNVYNAFQSSQALATMVNGLGGGGKVIAGHSLGNMLVSSAICDRSLTSDQYFMLNAAVAREAYSATHINGDRFLVRNPSWSDYDADTRLWSSDWWSLFPTNDGRYDLKWRGRFGTLSTHTNPHNYYSTGEEVLMKGDGSEPSAILEVTIKKELAWIKQEMSKGSLLKKVTAGVHTANGGWAFNGFWNGTPPATKPPLIANPYFKPFSEFFDENGQNPRTVHGATGSNLASQFALRAFMLAHDVPAVSNPAGSDFIDFNNNNVNDDAAKNTDMMGKRSGGWGGDWKHSDLKNQEIDRVFELYDDMVTKGNLKK